MEQTEFITPIKNLKLKLLTVHYSCITYKYLTRIEGIEISKQSSLPQNRIC